MRETVSLRDQREATHIAGEMAAQQLHAIIQERFEILRQRDGITKRDLARRLGVSDQLVSRWMAEPRNITVKSAGRLLAALDSHLGFELECYENILNANNGTKLLSNNPIFSTPEKTEIVERPNINLPVSGSVKEVAFSYG